MTVNEALERSSRKAMIGALRGILLIRANIDRRYPYRLIHEGVPAHPKPSKKPRTKQR